MPQFDLSNCRFAFLNLKTTGLSPWFGDRVCEIGLVLTEGRRIKQTYQQLINPQMPLSPAAASTNRLMDDELATAPLFSQVVTPLETLLRDTVIVCHNAQFDLQFLDDEFHRLGREFEQPNLIDTLFIAREHFDFPSYSLTNIATRFNIQNSQAHRARTPDGLPALADALTAKNVFSP